MYTRLCSGCSKELSYHNKHNLERAETAKSLCRKCTNNRINKLPQLKKKGNKNPAWKGYKDIPGKVFSRLKQGANNRNIFFNITIEDIQNQYEKQNKCCAFTLVSIEFNKEASVDRIDSSKGYTVDNIQIVHKVLNMMKKDLPNDIFIYWCKQIK